MRENIGQIIRRDRIERNLTMDDYGAVYDVSAPAIFKFEKGEIRPSLKLWMRIARDAGVSERLAVLLWLRFELPPRYKKYVEP